MDVSEIKKFLDKNNYDIRISGDARWIDQKCTFDVISIIADCILEFTQEKGVNTEFSVSDIWHTEFARENVISIFSKPDPELKASNEYDKYFGQPIKLLSYSKILSTRKVGKRYYYKINSFNLLQYIALRPTNALNFLVEYITKTLKDSGLFSSFIGFYEKQDKHSYQVLRDDFINFTIKNTKINTDVECGRIFTKIINPLAFNRKKKGSEKGRLSNNIITLSDLSYNRLNWRDELSGKSKDITREDYISTADEQRNNSWNNYNINKAKRYLRKFNDLFYDGESEVSQLTETVKATQAHHIFPQSDFPEIASFIENLIMLTPNQHFSMAHPNNKTQYIDKDFQYVCLISKLTKIKDNLTSKTKEKIYNFDDYIFVLNRGLDTNDFANITYLEFASIIEKIDYFYSDISTKYCDTVSINYPKL